MSKFRMIYTDCIFRGIIDSKNVAPPEDKWAEGALCRDNLGNIYILNRKAGDGVYGCSSIDADTLGLSSEYMTGDSCEIFEGDIVAVDCYETEEIMPPPEFDEDGMMHFPEREISEFPPIDAIITAHIEGVVFMSGGAFYIQIFDESTGALSAVPMGMYFGYDQLSLPGCAVRIMGNIYDNEELFNEVLRLNNTNMQ